MTTVKDVAVLMGSADDQPNMAALPAVEILAVTDDGPARQQLADYRAEWAR